VQRGTFGLWRGGRGREERRVGRVEEKERGGVCGRISSVVSRRMNLPFFLFSSSLIFLSSLQNGEREKRVSRNRRVYFLIFLLFFSSFGPRIFVW